MSHATELFKLRKEISRLEEELKQTNSELRLANATITGWRNRYEILGIEVQLLRESRADDEAAVEDRIRQQLLKQRKEISDLKAALRFEEFDEDTGGYREKQ